MTQAFASSRVAPLPQDVLAFRDNNWSLVATVYEEDATGSPSLFDLTGYTGWLAVKERDTHADSEIVIMKRTDDPVEGSIATPTNGEMTFLVVRADTVDLKAGVYLFDFGIFVGTTKRTVGRGQLTLQQPVLLGDVPAL